MMEEAIRIYDPLAAERFAEFHHVLSAIPPHILYPAFIMRFFKPCNRRWTCSDLAIEHPVVFSLCLVESLSALSGYYSYSGLRRRDDAILAQKAVVGVEALEDPELKGGNVEGYSRSS